MIHGKTLEKIISYLEQRDDVIAAYIFGSTVKNKVREDSDLDLAILFSENIDPYRRFQRKLQITNDLEAIILDIVDVVDLRSADRYFVHQVMKNRMLFFESDLQERVAFEVKHRKYYFDFLPLYRDYHRQSRKRLMEREAF